MLDQVACFVYWIYFRIIHVERIQNIESKKTKRKMKLETEERSSSPRLFIILFRIYLTSKLIIIPNQNIILIMINLIFENLQQVFLFNIC